MNTELVCLFGRDFTLIRVNQAWCALFALADNAAIGRSIFEFVPEKHHDEVKTDLLALSPETRAASHKHAAGFGSHTTAWVEWTYRIVLDQFGEAMAYEAVGHFAPGSD